MPQVNSIGLNNNSVHTSQTPDTSSGSTTVEKNKLKIEINNTKNKAKANRAESSTSQETVQTKCPPDVRKKNLEFIAEGGSYMFSQTVRERARKELAELAQLAAQESTTSQQHDTTSP